VDGTWLCEGYGLEAVERVCDRYHRPSLCHPERSRGICSSPNSERTPSEVAVTVDGTWLCEGYGLQAVRKCFEKNSALAAEAAFSSRTGTFSAACSART
jgi:hypothetical protein